MTLFAADDGFAAELFAAEDEFATALFAAAFPLFAAEDDLGMALASFLISAATAAAMEGDEMRKAGEDEANRSYIYGGRRDAEVNTASIHLLSTMLVKKTMQI